MKRIIYQTIVAVILILAGTACKKELGKLPENAKVDGNTILDQRTSEIALNGIYYRFANIDGTNTTKWFEHEIPSAMFAGYLGNGNGVGDRSEDNDYPNSSYSNIYWWSSYLLINAANGVIKGVTALDDKVFTGNRKKEILAEARFMRAYGHFKLLSYFGEWHDLNSAYGVLLRDQFVALGNISKKRSTVKESYTAILADLDDAITNAAATRPNIYVTRWTAMALKMRVLMSHAQQADYTTVIDLADSILVGNQYALESKAQDIFYLKGLSSKEVMLGIQPQQNQPTYYYNLSRMYWPGASRFFIAKQSLKDLLKNDPRSTWLVGNPIRSGSVNFYFLKYIAAGSAPAVVSETAYAFRLTEVYLLKAEAIVRAGGNLVAARNILKLVMARAGVTNFTAIDNAATPDELLKQIYFETAKNLIAEDGQEWMSLLRLPFTTVKQLKPTITNKIQYILPIPLEEFVSNPAFGEQNPGYTK